MFDVKLHQNGLVEVLHQGAPETPLVHFNVSGCIMVRSTKLHQNGDCGSAVASSKAAGLPATPL